MGSEAEREFEAFVTRHAASLGRLSYLLVGSVDGARDLTQSALETTWSRWSRVSRADEPVAYVRRIIANRAIDDARSANRRPKTVPLFDGDSLGRGGLDRDGVNRDSLGRGGFGGASPGTATGDHTTAVDDREVLRLLLSRLPARQRAVVVLRYFTDLSEVETAATLGISTGTVKSHAARALAALRVALTEGEVDVPDRR